MIEFTRSHWLARKAARINFGRVTVADHLRRLGFTETEVIKHRSKVGTQTRKAYERVLGAKPVKAGAEVVKMGKKSVLVRTYAYTWQELEILNAVLIDLGLL